jgi:hypothetical protein
MVWYNCGESSNGSREYISGQLQMYTRSYGGKWSLYFPLIWQGSHMKRRLQQFFVSSGASLPSCYLATIEGYTGRSTRTRVQQFFYRCVYSLLREHVHPAVAYKWTKRCILPIRCLAMIGGIHMTHRPVHRKYEVRRWDGLRCHDIHTKFQVFES